MLPQILLALDLLRAASYRADADEAVARVREVYTAIDDATDDPQLRRELRQICARESWCNLFRRVGQHAVDARPSFGLARWSGAVQAGVLRPDECPAHELGDDPARWSTWGAFGQTATGVGAIDGCLGPEAMADPLVAATAAVLAWERLCTERDACACEDRVAWWSGVGRFASLPPAVRLTKVERVCGRRAPLQRLGAVLTTAAAPWHWPGWWSA